MQKMAIDLEQVWQFYPVPDEAAQFEITEEWLERYNKVSSEFFEMRAYLEHCYRHQNGLKPYSDSPFKEV